MPIPAGLSGFKLPRGVQRRLTSLLDRQDAGQALSAEERREAEGLVELAEFLSLLKQCAQSAVIQATTGAAARTPDVSCRGAGPGTSHVRDLPQTRNGKESS